MSWLDSAAYLSTFAGCLVAVGASITSRAWRPSALVGRWALLAGAVTATVGLVSRWASVGHPPIFGTFENTYSLAWALATSATVASIMRPRWRGVWCWAAPWALASLLWGTRFRSAQVPLTISEQSLWVDVHVVFAWIALVLLLAASTLSILRLAGRRPLEMEGDDADVTLTNLLMAGFSALTALLAVGSWYLYVLFAVFWKWEIVETLTLIAWIGYGMVIHGRLFYRWRGRVLDIGVALLLPVLLLAFFIWSVFPGTYHYFDIPLVRPY